MRKQSEPEDVKIRDIWEARKRIAPVINRTPVVYSRVLSEMTDASIYLKLECLQKTGAFKLRGATNKILNLTPEERKCGIVAFSSGSHGLALAYLSKQLGINTTICISKKTPKIKIDALKWHGANVEIYGDSQDEAEIHCYELQKKYGLTFISSFDDPYIIAGQGTIGLELLEDVPEIDTVLIPLSGGGLVSGVGLALKSTDREIKVIGTSIEDSSVMYASLKAGHPVIVEEKPTLADCLLGGLGLNNKYTFKMIQEYMDSVQLFSEEEIAEGMVFMLEHHRMAIEGGSATGIAAALRKGVISPGSNAAIIITGNNVDYSVTLQVIENVMSKRR